MTNPMVTRALLSIHLIVSGITAGRSFYIALVDLPLFRSLTTEEYARSMREVLPRAGTLFVPALLIALLTAAALWFSATAGRRHWMAVGVLFLVVLGISVAVNIPINYELLAGRALTSELLEQLRQRWALAHWARTGLALLAFALAVVGVSKH